MNFFSKFKYKIYKKVEIPLTNIVYQNKNSNIYGKRKCTSYNINSINP